MSSDISVKTADFPSIIERVGKITTVIASLSLLFSVVYDWGFISAIGLQFSEVPTSVSDHVRSWLLWLPHVIIGLFAILIFELLTRRIERGMTEDEIIHSSSNPLRTEKRRRRPFFAAGILGVSLVVLWLLFGEFFQDGVHMGLIITWFMFSGWVFSHPTVRARYSEGFRLIVHWTPPIMIFFFHLGGSDAALQLNPSRPTDVLQLKSSPAAASPLQVHILRGFDEWILVQDNNKQVLWIRSDDVLRIESHLERTPFRGIACGLYDALCLTPKTPLVKQK